MKKQFIHGLNDNVMVAQIIWKLTKTKESADITSEQVLGWAKRVEAQRAQSAITDSLTKTKVFDKIKIAKGGLRHTGGNVQTHAKAPTKNSCNYCSSTHPSRQYPAYGKKCADCGKSNHFREVCRSRRNNTVHDIEQEPDQHNIEEDHIDTVNINLIIFNSKWLAITANLKMSWYQASIIIPYKVDKGNDGNIMPSNFCKKLFPRAINEQLAGTKNKHVQLKNITNNSNTVGHM